MIVIDASAVCDLLLGRGDERRLIDLVLTDGASVHAPELVNVEVLHVMRRMTITGALSAARANEMRADFAELPIHCYPSNPLLDRAWALREDVTAYDALYVALAEALDATLVTTDHKLAHAAVQASTVSVEAIG